MSTEVVKADPAGDSAEKPKQKELKSLPARTVMTMDNARVNMLVDVYIPSTLPRFDVTIDSPTYLRLFRHYPLTELEARSLHFKGSSPMHWIEEHLRDLLRLELFDAGYDARNIKFDFEYIPFLVQEEEIERNSPLVQHIYTWAFDRENELLVLTDNGDEVLVQKTRGPQSYVWLTEEERKIRALAARPAAVTETIRK
jgi:hypothetical protein